MRKITAVRRDIAERVESSEESYALAARSKGYAPSGAAYPVTGVNNIVAGNRRIPGTKYVIYQGPQYVNARCHVDVHGLVRQDLGKWACLPQRDRHRR